MKIDLLQVNSQSFSAKGQGESALTAKKTRKFHVCACAFLLSEGVCENARSFYLF